MSKAIDTAVTNVFTPEQVKNLHKYQFGPWDSPLDQMHPFTCENRGDGHHFNNGADLGALIPTVRGWICQSCDYTQNWAHGFMCSGSKEQSLGVKEYLKVLKSE